MKRLLGTIALVAMAAAPATAADLPYKVPPPVVPAWSWTGCYIGGHVGGGFGRKDWSPDPSDVAAGLSIQTHGSLIGQAAQAPLPVTDLGSDFVTGILGGVQGGCDYQFSQHFLVGAQADFSWSNLSGKHTSNQQFNNGGASGSENFSSHTTVDRFGTITGRAGYSSDRALFYLKGGAAWVRDRYTFEDDITPASIVTPLFIVGAASATRWGWTVGAGFEYALLPNLSAFVEYDYLAFGNHSGNFSCAGFENSSPLMPLQTSCGRTAGIANTTVPIDVRQQINVVRLGLNYRFNWWGGPITTRY
jgi:outer membrane immunogenic protein